MTNPEVPVEPVEPVDPEDPVEHEAEEGEKYDGGEIPRVAPEAAPEE